MNLPELIRSLGDEIGVRSSLMLSPCRRSRTSHARALVARRIRDMYPSLDPKVIAKAFGVSRSAVMRWLSPEFVTQPIHKWPVSPEKIVAEWNAKASAKMLRLMQDVSHSREAVAWRHEMLRDIEQRCPGISSGRIAEATGLHHTTVLYALGKRTQMTYRHRRRQGVYQLSL